MTREEAIKWLNVERELIVEIPQDNSKELKEAYAMAINALEQEPCEDAISREALSYAVNTIKLQNDETWYSFYQKVLCRIHDLPSVTPTRPKGEWILDDGLRRIHKCSNCGQLIMTDDIDVYNYCHGCGADMRGDADED